MTRTLYLTLQLCIFSLLASAQNLDSLRSYYQKGVAAYEAEDYETFLAYTQKANEIRPNHPTLTYNLASAYALNEQPEKSIATLKSFLMMNASTAYQKDSDFVSLWEMEEFKALEEVVKNQSKKIINSEIAFEIPQTDHHIESIGFGESQFFLGAVNTRQLLSFKNDLIPIKQHYANRPLFAVMGIDKDPNSDQLWVCTAALPEAVGDSSEYHDTSNVLSINLKSGDEQYFFVPNAILGDIIVLDNGDVIASDGFNNQLYSITKTGKLSVWLDLSEQVFNLQGIAQADNYLFVSDYITGLYRINMKNQKVEKIKSNGLYVEKGIDGLLAYQNKLIAFQNGTTPKRALSITLDGNECTEMSIIDQNISDTGEPTQGVIIDDRLYYLSTSAWGAYQKGLYQSDKAPSMQVRTILLNK